MQNQATREIIEHMEIWKDILNYEGAYQISSLGKVKSLHRIVASGKNHCRTVEERILKTHIGKTGYEKVKLSKGGNSRRVSVHRLVAQAFLPNPKSKAEVNHKDFSKSNNVLTNLEWVSPEENRAHAVANNNAGGGETSWVKALCIDDAQKYKSRSEWAKAPGAAYGSARRGGWLEECCAHMAKTHRVEWTKDKCLSDAKYYKTRSAWGKGSNVAYRTALKHGWVKECAGHMQVCQINWTKESCVREARRYPTNKDWYTKSFNSYQIARKRGWLEDCREHMSETPK